MNDITISNPRHHVTRPPDRRHRLSEQTPTTHRAVLDRRPRCATGCGRIGAVVSQSRNFCTSCYSQRRALAVKKAYRPL